MTELALIGGVLLGFGLAAFLFEFVWGPDPDLARPWQPGDEPRWRR